MEHGIVGYTALKKIDVKQSERDVNGLLKSVGIYGKIQLFTDYDAFLKRVKGIAAHGIRRKYGKSWRKSGIISWYIPCNPENLQKKDGKYLMRELVIGVSEAGGRLDKYLQNYMALAPKSFFYKMFRKKNITCNGKKCEGNERLCEGDVIRLFLAEETIETFRKQAAQAPAYPNMELSVIYEEMIRFCFSINQRVFFLSVPVETEPFHGGIFDRISSSERFCHCRNAPQCTACGLQPAGSEHQRTDHRRKDLDGVKCLIGAVSRTDRGKILSVSGKGAVSRTPSRPGGLSFQG